jgi:hypothetical protein
MTGGRGNMITAKDGEWNHPYHPLRGCSGSHVTSTKWKYMVNEKFAKARLYNMFLAVKV